MGLQRDLVSMHQAERALSRLDETLAAGGRPAPRLGQRQLIDAPRGHRLEQVVVGLVDPPLRQHPSVARQLQAQPFRVEPIRAGFAADHACGRLQQQGVAAIQADDHAGQIARTLPGDRDLETEVAIAQAGIGQVLSKQCHRAGTNAVAASEGQQGLVAQGSTLGMDPASHLPRGSRSQCIRESSSHPNIEPSAVASAAASASASIGPASRAR